jgi:hypothetical protein
MRKFLTHLGIVAGIGTAAFAISLTSAGQAVAQGIKPILVQVINTSAEAVPVTGIVRVANVTGTPLETRDVAARNAFSQQIRLDVTGIATADFTIPPGKRLVVECVSISGFDSRDGGDPAIFLSAAIGDAPSTSYRLAPGRVEPSGVLVPPDSFAGTQLVRFYADALNIAISFGGDTTNVGSFVVTVSGYLVDQA